MLGKNNVLTRRTLPTLCSGVKHKYLRINGAPVGKKHKNFGGKLDISMHKKQVFGGEMSTRRCKKQVFGVFLGNCRNKTQVFGGKLSTSRHKNKSLGVASY